MNKDQVTSYCNIISIVGELVGNIESDNERCYAQIKNNKLVSNVTSNLIEILKDKNQNIVIKAVYAIVNIFKIAREIDDTLIFELVVQLTILLQKKKKAVYQDREYFAIVKAIAHVTNRTLINKNIKFEDEIRLPLLKYLVKELPNLTTAKDEIILYMVLNIIRHLTTGYNTEDDSINYISNCIKKLLDRDIDYNYKDLNIDILNMGKS